VPVPGERLRINARYLGVDSGHFMFEWRIDGRIVSNGVGADQLELLAPPVGDAVNVEVVLSGGGRSYEKNILISPSDVQLEWEGIGLGYTPSNVRVSFSPHGTVRVAAIPSMRSDSGTPVEIGDIYFAWKVGSTEMKKESGYGKDEIEVPTQFFDQAFSVSVTARSRDGTHVAQRNIQLKPRAPSAVVYTFSQLAGVNDQNAVVARQAFSEQEISFVGYPLNVAEHMAPMWLLEGGLIDSSAGNPWIVTFRKTGEGTGEFQVTLQYKSKENFLDKYVRSFLVYF
jgi:hypothetical protein